MSRTKYIAIAFFVLVALLTVKFSTSNTSSSSPKSSSSPSTSTSNSNSNSISSVPKTSKQQQQQEQQKPQEQKQQQQQENNSPSSSSESPSSPSSSTNNNNNNNNNIKPGGGDRGDFSPEKVAVVTIPSWILNPKKELRYHSYTWKSATEYCSRHGYSCVDFSSPQISKQVQKNIVGWCSAVHIALLSSSSSTSSATSNANENENKKYDFDYILYVGPDSMIMNLSTTIDEIFIRQNPAGEEAYGHTLFGENHAANDPLFKAKAKEKIQQLQQEQHHISVDSVVPLIFGHDPSPTSTFAIKRSYNVVSMFASCAKFEQKNYLENNLHSNDKLHDKKSVIRKERKRQDFAGNRINNEEANTNTIRKRKVNTDGEGQIEEHPDDNHDTLPPADDGGHEGLEDELVCVRFSDPSDFEKCATSHNVDHRIVDDFSGMFAPVGSQYVENERHEDGAAGGGGTIETHRKISSLEKYSPGRFIATFSYCKPITTESCLLRMQTALSHCAAVNNFEAIPLPLPPEKQQQQQNKKEENNNKNPKNDYGIGDDQTTLHPVAEFNETTTTAATSVNENNNMNNNNNDTNNKDKDNDNDSFPKQQITEPIPEGLTRPSFVISTDPTTRKKHMKIAVLTYASYDSDSKRRKYSEELIFRLSKFGWKNKKYYSDHWGYDFIQEGPDVVRFDSTTSTSTSSSSSSAQQKVDLATATTRAKAFGKIKSILKWLPYYDWVLWMDTDSLIMNFNHTIESIIQHAEIASANHYKNIKNQQQQQQKPKEEEEKQKNQEETPSSSPSSAEKLQRQQQQQYDCIIAKDWNGINSGIMLWRYSKWSMDFLQRVDKGLPQYMCPLPDTWWEQRVMMCLLDRVKAYNPRQAGIDRDHVLEIEFQRLFNSYGPTSDLGHQSAAYRKGDFIVHFPSCRHEPRCFYYFKKMYRDMLVQNGNLPDYARGKPPIYLFPENVMKAKKRQQQQQKRQQGEEEEDDEIEKNKRKSQKAKLRKEQQQEPKTQQKVAKNKVDDFIPEEATTTKKNEKVDAATFTTTVITTTTKRVESTEGEKEPMDFHNNDVKEHNKNNNAGGGEGQQEWVEN